MSSDDKPNETETETEDDFDFFYDFTKAAQNRSQCWTEENWQEEMEKHPLFATKTPEIGEKLPELIEGLSQLKYDSNFNSIEELLEGYRQDGNENFRLKKYRWAVDSYSEGIFIAFRHFKSNPNYEKKLLNNALSILFNNRASAHYYLENYRSSMQDATRAIVLNEKNHKAILRFGQSCFKLKKYPKCIEFCQEKLSKIKDLNLDLNIEKKIYQELQELLKNAQTNQKILDRDRRKMDRINTVRFSEQEKIENAVNLRGIKFRGSLFQTGHSAAWGKFVHFDLNNPELLIWPVIFIYSEKGQTDFIENFQETLTFFDQFQIMFSKEYKPEWDPECKYRPETIKCFYHHYQFYTCDGEEKSEINLKQFDSKLRLIDALKLKNFYVHDAIPTFVLKID